MSFHRITYLLSLLLTMCVTVSSQTPIKGIIIDNDSLIESTIINPDSLLKLDAIPDTLTRGIVPQESEFIEVIHPENDSLNFLFGEEPKHVPLTRKDSLAMKRLERQPFSPSPKKAVIYAAIFPGLGQIYNRKYWKLPIVYGGFMGCIYAITWNNKNLQDYTQAHRDLLYDQKYNKDKKHEWHKSWQYYVRTGQEEQEFNGTNLSSSLKRGKDFYRRYRDLSIIISIGVYAIWIIDAYVDAELFNFDITPELTMRVEPAIVPETTYSAKTYGLSCHFTF